MKKSKDLEILNTIVPGLAGLVKDDTPNVEYNVKDGTAFGFNLFHTPEVAVQRVFISKGTIFPKHQHNENEYVLIYKGKVKLIIEDPNHCILIKGKSSKDRVLGVGDGVFFPPGMPHSGLALVDTWMLSVTIPAGEGYPDD